MLPCGGLDEVEVGLIVGEHRVELLYRDDRNVGICGPSSGKHAGGAGLVHDEAGRGHVGTEDAAGCSDKLVPPPRVSGRLTYLGIPEFSDTAVPEVSEAASWPRSGPWFTSPGGRWSVVVEL